MSDSSQHYGLQPARLLCPWDSPVKTTSMGCHALLQRIFLTQGLNPCLLCLLNCRWILYTEPQEKSLIQANFHSNTSISCLKAVKGLLYPSVYQNNSSKDLIYSVLSSSSVTDVIGILPCLTDKIALLSSNCKSYLWVQFHFSQNNILKLDYLPAR